MTFFFRMFASDLGNHPKLKDNFCFYFYLFELSTCPSVHGETKD